MHVDDIYLIRFGFGGARGPAPLFVVASACAAFDISATPRLCFGKESKGHPIPCPPAVVTARDVAVAFAVVFYQICALICAVECNLVCHLFVSLG